MILYLLHFSLFFYLLFLPQTSYLEVYQRLFKLSKLKLKIINNLFKIISYQLIYILMFNIINNISVKNNNNKY